VLASLARELAWNGMDLARAARFADAAIATARAAGDRATLAACLLARHNAGWGPQNAADRLALAGQVRTLEHNWELDFYGPRGLAKARMGDRPRIDPEAVRQAQPGEAWVIQAGQSLHLRVLPPPTVAPEPVELAAALPLGDDTIPLPVQEPAPVGVGIAAAMALAGRTARQIGQRIGRRRERTGRLPSPAWRPWLPVRPLPGRGRR
jgi:hypothetical protein